MVRVLYTGANFVPMAVPFFCLNKQSPNENVLFSRINWMLSMIKIFKKVHVGNDQEMTQSERNFHSISQGVGKKWHPGTYTKKTCSQPSEQLLPNRRPLSNLN